MKWFRVGGDYGPQGGDYIEYFILTKNRARAKILFAQRIARDFPSMWRKMGMSNISVFEK